MSRNDLIRLGKLVFWTIVLCLMLVLAYLSLMEFVTRHGYYSGYEAHLWTYAYIGSVGIVFYKVSRLAYPVDIETVEVIKYLPYPKIVEVDKIISTPVERIVTVEREVPITRRVPRHEVIYILRRADGILKFGRTGDLKDRIIAHQIDYKAKFEIVACWVVPNSFSYEQLALRMTEEFSYCEIGRKELRKMTKPELNKFILKFTRQIQKGYNQQTGVSVQTIRGDLKALNGAVANGNGHPSTSSGHSKGA